MNARENLKAYLDGELSASERAQMELALVSDQGLRDELADLEQLSLAVRSGAREFEVRGFDETRLRLVRRRSRGVWWRTFGTVAVVGVLAAILMPVFSQRSDSVGAATSLAKSAEEAISTASSAAEGAADTSANLSDEGSPAGGAEGFRSKPASGNVVEEKVAPSSDNSALQSEKPGPKQTLNEGEGAKMGRGTGEAEERASAEILGRDRPFTGQIVDKAERDLTLGEGLSEVLKGPNRWLGVMLIVSVALFLFAATMAVFLKLRKVFLRNRGSGPEDSGSV